MKHTVYVVDLSRPEQEHIEEVGTRQEGDEESDDHSQARGAEDSWRNHGVSGEFCLPDEEGNDENDTDAERHENVH